MTSTDKIPQDRLEQIMAYKARIKTIKEDADKLPGVQARLASVLTALGTDADGLDAALASIRAKAADMEGVAGLVSAISNTAYKLLPSALRAVLDKYRG